MAHSRIIDDLIARDPARVRADLEAIQNEKTALEAEEALLNQVLAIQAMRLGGDKPAENADLVVDNRSTEIKRTRREGPSISGAVLDVMRAHPGAWLDYDDVHARLAKGGVRATRNAMRVALNRWAERGELAQDTAGRFRYPGAAQPALAPDEGVLDT